MDVHAGVLSVPNLNNIGFPGPLEAGDDLQVNGGATFRYTGAVSDSTDKRVSVTGGSIDVVTAGVTVTLHELFGSSLTKRGAGTLTLEDSAEDFDGSVTVVEGILIWPNASTSGSVPIQIEEGAELRASGIILFPISGKGAITAYNDILLGSQGNATGFDFDGLLSVFSRDVVLLDADVAELGSATMSGGSLGANSSIELADTLTGHGTISGIFNNQGTVTGSAPGLNFTGYITGPGDFLGNVTFSGVYSPGNSPARVDLGNPTFVNKVTIEIGGLILGTQHDQLDATGTATLGGELEIDLINAFVPSAGQVFRIMEYGSRVGVFAPLDGQIFGVGAGQFFQPIYTADHLSLYVPLPGDANFDGIVSGADFTLWADHFGQSGFATPMAGWAAGDFSGDNTVTGADFTLWADHFGDSVSLDAVSVPEPGAWSLLVARCCSGCTLRRYAHPFADPAPNGERGALAPCSVSFRTVTNRNLGEEQGANAPRSPELAGRRGIFAESVRWAIGLRS